MHFFSSVIPMVFNALNYGLRTCWNPLYCKAFGGVHETQVTALETPCYDRADFAKNRAKPISRSLAAQCFLMSITRGLANPLQRNVSVARVTSTTEISCSAALFVTRCSCTLKPLAAQCFWNWNFPRYSFSEPSDTNGFAYVRCAGCWDVLQRNWFNFCFSLQCF